MITLKNFYLYFFISVFFALISSGCGIVPFKFFSASNIQNKKINNLVDVNGDNKSDLVFWNIKFPDCIFETFNFPNSRLQVSALGKTGDIPIFGDFTGDNYYDYGVYRYTTGGNVWLLVDGLTKSTSINRFGDVGDIPIPSDYDGDGKFDFVIYRPKNSGFYGYLSNKNKVLEIHFGVTGDIPTPKDYDGDGKADIAVYRRSSGSWSIKSSRSGLPVYIMLGGPNYFPIPSDYDGDGLADIAVWNYKNNKCKIIFSFLNQKLSDENILKIQQKLQGKKLFPVSSDFDGDGKSELAFWESSNNLLHVFKIKKNDHKYETFDLDSEKGSIPINYFLLKKYLSKPCILTAENLYKKFTKAQAPSREKQTISFNDITGKPLVGDFDGDGKNDLALVNIDEKSLTYFSSALNKFVSLSLDSRLEGIPFSADIDFDLMSDVVFYNPDTNIFGFTRSSDNYEYGEVLKTTKSKKLKTKS